MTAIRGTVSPPDLKFFEHQPIRMRTPKSKAAQGRVREECFQEETSMSSPITPPQGPAAARPPRPAEAARSAAALQGAGKPFASELAVALDTVPPSPPQEVLEEMASAARNHEALRAQGRELRFSRDEQNGRTRIEVRDRSGNVLKTLSPAQALEVAAGAPVE
jgi:hypothetical protein